MSDLYYLAAVGLLFAAPAATVAASTGATIDPSAAVVKVSAKPMHSGRISTKLYGGFIELLDDLTPGMWAEMLNDRSFEGVGRASNWCYYTGVPNFCDRVWEENKTWSYDTKHPFNGSRSARLTASKGKPAGLSQSGLAVKKGMDYIFSGYFRTDSAKIKTRVVLKSRSLEADPYGHFRRC